MKKKKILSLVALGALLILPLSVNAAAYPIRTVIYSSAELVRRDAQSSSTYSKEGWSSQYLQHNSSITPLTNPCPKCELMTKLVQVEDDGSYRNTFAPIITVAGEEKALNVGSSVSEPGNYYLILQRNDFTLLNTHITYRWRLNYNP